MRDLLLKVPKEAISVISEWFYGEDIAVLLVSSRKTKWGDYRRYPNGKRTITLNADLNPDQLLFTFAHEWAHYKIDQIFGRFVTPHGREWKEQFRKFLIILLQERVFSIELEKELIEFIKKPKATIPFFLKEPIESEETVFLKDIPIGDFFLFRNKQYQHKAKKRTRSWCVSVDNKRIYTIPKNARVFIVEN